MWVVVISSFFAILLAYLSKFKGKSHLFELAFIIVTFIAAIHYDYGNDYMTYFDRWKQLRFERWGDILSGDTNWGVETGWAILNKMFGFNGGFFILVALLNIFQNYIYYKLIKRFVPPSNRWLAMLIYLCTSGLYLLNFSMMRQGLAVALFVATILLLTSRKLIFAIVALIVAISMHKTAVIGVPFLILYFLPLKSTKSLSVIVASMGVALFFATSLASDLFNSLITSVEILNQYENMGEGMVAEESLGLGFVLLHIPHIVFLYCLWSGEYFRDEKEKILTIVAFFDILIIPFTSIGSAFMSRLGIYFLAFHVAVIPMLYSRLKKKEIRVGLTFIVVFIMLYAYRGFFQTSYWRDTFGGPFHTIFSQL